MERVSHIANGAEVWLDVEKKPYLEAVALLAQVPSHTTRVHLRLDDLVLLKTIMVMMGNSRGSPSKDHHHHDTPKIVSAVVSDLVESGYDKYPTGGKVIVLYMSPRPTISKWRERAPRSPDEFRMGVDRRGYHDAGASHAGASHAGASKQALIDLVQFGRTPPDHLTQTLSVEDHWRPRGPKANLADLVCPAPFFIRADNFDDSDDDDDEKEKKKKNTREEEEKAILDLIRLLIQEDGGSVRLEEFILDATSKYLRKEYRRERYRELAQRRYLGANQMSLEWVKSAMYAWDVHHDRVGLRSYILGLFPQEWTKYDVERLDKLFTGKQQLNALYRPRDNGHFSAVDTFLTGDSVEKTPVEKQTNPFFFVERYDDDRYSWDDVGSDDEDDDDEDTYEQHEERRKLLVPCRVCRQEETNPDDNSCRACDKIESRIQSIYQPCSLCKKGCVATEVASTFDTWRPVECLDDCEGQHHAGAYDKCMECQDRVKFAVNPSCHQCHRERQKEKKKQQQQQQRIQSTEASTKGERDDDGDDNDNSSKKVKVRRPAEHKNPESEAPAFDWHGLSIETIRELMEGYEWTYDPYGTRSPELVCQSFHVALRDVARRKYVLPTSIPEGHAPPPSVAQLCSELHFFTNHSPPAATRRSRTAISHGPGHLLKILSDAGGRPLTVRLSETGSVAAAKGEGTALSVARDMLRAVGSSIGSDTRAVIELIEPRPLALSALRDTPRGAKVVIRTRATESCVSLREAMAIGGRVEYKIVTNEKQNVNDDDDDGNNNNHDDHRGEVIRFSYYGDKSKTLIVDQEEAPCRRYGWTAPSMHPNRHLESLVHMAMEHVAEGTAVDRTIDLLVMKLPDGRHARCDGAVIGSIFEMFSAMAMARDAFGDNAEDRDPWPDHMDTHQVHALGTIAKSPARIELFTEGQCAGVEGSWLRKHSGSHDPSAGFDWNHPRGGLRLVLETLPVTHQTVDCGGGGGDAGIERLAANHAWSRQLASLSDMVSTRYVFDDCSKYTTTRARPPVVVAKTLTEVVFFVTKGPAGPESQLAFIRSVLHQMGAVQRETPVHRILLGFEPGAVTRENDRAWESLCQSITRLAKQRPVYRLELHNIPKYLLAILFTVETIVRTDPLAATAAKFPLPAIQITNPTSKSRVVETVMTSIHHVVNGTIRVDLVGKGDALTLLFDTVEKKVRFKCATQDNILRLPEEIQRALSSSSSSKNEAQVDGGPLDKWIVTEW